MLTKNKAFQLLQRFEDFSISSAEIAFGEFCVAALNLKNLPKMDWIFLHPTVGHLQLTHRRRLSSVPTQPIH